MGRCWSATLVALVVLVASCGGPDARTTSPPPSAHPTVPVTHHSATPSASRTGQGPSVRAARHHEGSRHDAHLLCDPGLGHPNRSPSCPDPHPETAWLRSGPGEPLVLKPFRTFVDDAAGRAYARRHHLGFPFPDDYLDAPLPGSHPLRLSPDTVCTGSIRVGYRDPLSDHRVRCSLLVRAAAATPLPVAVWRVQGRPVQVSELFRP